MNFNALQEAASTKSFGKGMLQSKKYTLPLTYANLLDERTSVFEYFNLSYTQRLVCSGVCMVLGIFFLMNSLMNVFSIPIRPDKFSFPYAISNFCFFVMVGFLVGFKSYFKGVFSREIRVYSTTFLFATFMTIYSTTWKSSILRSLKFIFPFLQVSTFCMFAYVYFMRKLKNTAKIFNFMSFIRR